MTILGLFVIFFGVASLSSSLCAQFLDIGNVHAFSFVSNHFYVEHLGLLIEWMATAKHFVIIHKNVYCRAHSSFAMASNKKKISRLKSSGRTFKIYIPWIIYESLISPNIAFGIFYMLLAIQNDNTLNHLSTKKKEIWMHTITKNKMSLFISRCSPHYSGNTFHLQIGSFFLSC